MAWPRLVFTAEVVGTTTTGDEGMTNAEATLLRPAAFGPLMQPRNISSSVVVFVVVVIVVVGAAAVMDFIAAVVSSSLCERIL